MPEGAVAHSEAMEFLATVPLLDGMPEPELSELARVARRRELPAGEVLWREGDEASAMVWIVDGRVSVSLGVRRPGLTAPPDRVRAQAAHRRRRVRASAPPAGRARGIARRRRPA